jgi:hypothetical protein
MPVFWIQASKVTVKYAVIKLGHMNIYVHYFLDKSANHAILIK